MPKAYLRYEEEHVFGVIASPSSNVAYDKTGKLAVVGALVGATLGVVTWLETGSVERVGVRAGT